VNAVKAGVPMDPDYNNFDSFHATTPHPHMSREVWERAFRDAWAEFYSYAHMRRSLLRQNPHTYWAVLKNLIWYRSGMIEGAHPMITGFFRLKDRRSRRSTFPIERRWPFFRRRAREITQVLSEYLKLYFEIQDLWLQTRIRREEYRFLGDLRRLASRSMQDVKLNWARVHTAVAARAGTLQEALGDRMVLGTTMAERLDAVREALGTRATAIRESVAERTESVRARVDASIADARRSLSARARAVHAALNDLHLPQLRPIGPPSWPTRAIRRLNLFSLDRVEHDPRLTAYWLRTRHRLATLQFWRLNPIAFSWNLARGTRRAIIFLVAMAGERY